jgi:hypothetical protein
MLLLARSETGERPERLPMAFTPPSLTAYTSRFRNVVVGAQPSASTNTSLTETIRFDADIGWMRARRQPLYTDARAFASLTMTRSWPWAGRASSPAALKAERASLAAQGRKIETEAAPIRYVGELLGLDTDSEKAIRWLIALMALCCDPLAIALTAAASARR